MWSVLLSGWFVPYRDLSKPVRLEACASLCFRLFLESEARSCSDQAGDDLLAVLWGPAYKSKGFLVIGVKCCAWGPVHSMGSYSAPLWCLLLLGRDKVGFPNPGQADLHPSAPPWSQPGKERKVQPGLCWEEISEGWHWFSRALSFAGYNQQWPRSYWWAASMQKQLPVLSSFPAKRTSLSRENC